MSARGWLREEQADLAVEKLLDAAEAVFVERGVAGAGMGDIARAAGCSRGTLYRYFKTRRELHLAYVERTAEALALRIAAGIADIDDPAERIVEGVVRCLRDVRGAPATAAWFAPADSGIAADVSRDSEVIDRLAEAFVTQLLVDRQDPAASLRARWLVRVIVSLLTVPGSDEAEEREIVARFVAPVLLADSGV